MEENKIVRKIIDSHINASFKSGVKLYDREQQLEQAKINGCIIVDTQIKLIESGSEDFIIKDITNKNISFWKNIKKLIKEFNYD